MTGALYRHRAFLTILLAGLLVRTVAVLAYQPALWYSDSLGYAAIAVHPYPAAARPSGYSLFLLWPLHPLHSFALVVIAQHVLGLGTGIIIYALLLRRGVRAWVAALISAPILLSAYEIQIEHFILSDSLFIFLLVAAIAVMLWNRSPGWLACIIAGLLLAAATDTRTEGLPLLVAPVVWLVTRPNTKWRTRLAQVLLICIAFALPTLSYANWFRQSHGQLRLTYSTGAFLAARAESFANCATDNLPRTDRWLCAAPGRKPDWYLWTPGTPLSRAKGGAFTAVNDKRGTAFAVRVFESQPGEYLLTTWQAILQNFSSGGSAYSNGQAAFAFPAHPATLALLAGQNPGNTTGPIYRYDAHPSTRLAQPWASALRVYQQIFVVPPTVMGLITLISCGGILLAWKRRGGPALLPWAIGAILVVVPAATSGFGTRYELVATAPLCIAAVLGLMEIRGHSPEPAVKHRPSHAVVRSIPALHAWNSSPAYEGQMESRRPDHAWFADAPLPAADGPPEQLEATQPIT